MYRHIQICKCCVNKKLDNVNIEHNLMLLSDSNNSCRGNYNMTTMRVLTWYCNVSFDEYV